jgi:predicted MFS family arabinose efflux permease
MIAGQVTASLGLPLGGVVVGLAGWRATFLVNVPLALIGIALTLLWIPADKARPARSGRSLFTELDVVGIALFGGAIAGLLVFLSELSDPLWWLLPVVAALTTALILWERRALTPFIDVRMLAANSPLRRTYLRNAATSVATYCILYGLSQWMEESRDLNPVTTGLLLLPMAVFGAVASAFVARRAAVRGPLIATGVAGVIGGVLVLFVDSQSSLVLLVVITLVFGITSGVGSVSNQAALYLQTSSDDIAVASGLLRTSTYIGAVFSASLIGITYDGGASDEGLHIIGLVLGGLGVALALAALLDRRLRPGAAAVPSP